jgi:hypothetical protein
LPDRAGKEWAAEQTEMPPDNENYSTERFPFSLLQNLMKLHNGPPGKLGMDAGAEELYCEHMRSLRAETDERKRKLFMRAPELLIRLGSTFAASRFTPRIELSDAEVAEVVVNQSKSNWLRGLEQAEGKKEMEDRTTKQVLEQRFKTK